MVATPSAGYIKRTACPSCGANKELPSSSAYLYCDFCGQLADWDLRRACEDPTSALPGPAYRTLQQQLAPQIQAALNAHDVERFRDLQKYLFEGYVVHAPKAVPPRAWNDAAYRNRYVAHLAEAQVVTRIDQRASDYMVAVQQRTQALQWIDRMAMKVHAPSLWPLIDVVVEQHVYTQDLFQRTGVADLDPDRSTPATMERIARSMLAQGWMPTLDPTGQQHLVERLGIRDEYRQAAPPAGTVRHCGGCGADLVALPGATVVVCLACGRRVDLTGSEVVCDRCGGRLSLPEHQPRTNCPYCQAEVRRI